MRITKRMNKTITAAATLPTVDSARELGIFSEVANGRIRVWGPLAEVKRWWALAGVDLVEVTDKAGLAPGQVSAVDSWDCEADGRYLGCISAMVEDQPMVREGAGWAAMIAAPAGTPRGRMAYSYTAIA